MEGMIRGYSVLASGRFVTEDTKVHGRVPAEVLEAVAAQQSRIKPGAWYPRSEVLLSWRAVAFIMEPGIGCIRFWMAF